MKISTVVTVAAGAAALLMGCTITPVEQAGGDDFPNMIASAGTSISQNLNQQWTNPAEASMEAFSGIVQAPIPALSIKFSLGKRVLFTKRANADSVRYEISPSGLITAFMYSSTDSSIKRDTLVAKVVGGDTLIVSIRGDIVRTKLLSIVEWYRYVDYDGDSILINPGAVKQQALSFSGRQFPAGRTETVSVVVDAGIDRDFQKESDNRYLSFASLTKIKEDTVSFAQLSDADGDGFVIDHGSSVDSCLVDIVTQSKELLQPANRTTARMVVFPADSTKNYAIRYGVVNRFVNRTVCWSIVAKGGDSTFFPGDTVTVSRIVDHAIEDTVTVDSLSLLAVLGPDPQDSLDDALIGIHLHTTFHSGAINRETIFIWGAATALKNGQTPRDGSVYYKSVFANGEWLEAVGTIDKTAITAGVETSGGKKYAVAWDSTGKLLYVNESTK